MPTPGTAGAGPAEAPIKRVRAIDGLTILPGRRLSMHVLVQPEAAAGFLANPTLRDQGLVSRILVAAPDSIAGTRFYRETDPRDDAAIGANGARILSILEAPLPLAAGAQNELAPRAIPLGAAAVQAWRRFFDRIERDCGSARALRPIGDFAAKAAEHAARIAGVLTLVDALDAAEIGAAVMANGLILAEWYLAEALRLQAGARMDAKLIAAATLLEWLKAQPDDVHFRDILRLGPNALRTKAEAALRTLIDHGWIVEVDGRPRRFRLAVAGGLA